MDLFGYLENEVCDTKLTTIDKLLQAIEIEFLEISKDIFLMYFSNSIRSKMPGKKGGLKIILIHMFFHMYLQIKINFCK